MTAKVLVRALLVASMLVLSACGGGEEGDDWDIAGALFDSLWDAAFDSPDTPPALSLSEPSSSGYYVTTAEALQIGGTTSDSDADIIWTNSAGSGGDMTPRWRLCFFSCEYDWSFTAPLSVGYNLITVVAAGDGGETVATIAVMRY